MLWFVSLHALLGVFWLLCESPHLLWSLWTRCIYWLPGGGSDFKSDEASMLVACICLHTICNSGMCVFIWFFPLFFLTEVFWRGFFPWACWPHVLNKFVFCWLIPGLSVGFSLCIVWTLFLLLCLDFCTLPNTFYSMDWLLYRVHGGCRWETYCTCTCSSLHNCSRIQWSQN